MASPVQFPKQQEIIDESIEAPRDKFWRKIKEQPLIPIGSLLTCGALIAASHQLRKGNKEEFNRALRWRVGFQGLTVAAAVAGSLYYGAKAPLPPPPPPASSIDPSSSTDHQALSKSNYYTPAKVETLPGRPATNLQQSRAEEKKKEDSILLRKRIKEAEEKDRKEREMVERALMGESSASNRENLDSSSSSSQSQDQNSSSSGSLFRSWFGSGKGNNGQDQISEDSNKGPMRDSRGRPIIGQDSRRQ